MSAMASKRSQWSVVVRETEPGEPRVGEVIEVRATRRRGSRMPPSVVAGDTVLFDIVKAKPLTRNGEGLAMLDEQDVVRLVPEVTRQFDDAWFEELRRMRLESKWRIAQMKRMLA